jgi:hypothetical protein
MATLIVNSELAGPAVVGRGGQAMYNLQWLHGLERQGHNVIFLEFLKQDPGSARESVVGFFRDTVTRWWHPNKSSLIIEDSTTALFGLGIDQVAKFVAESAAVITIAAFYRREPHPLIANLAPRILVEQDPAYTHIWAAAADPKEIFGEHDVYYTVGLNIGSTRCSVPTSGIDWIPIVNPVVLDWWTTNNEIERDRFTTVADWRSYGYLEFQDRVLGPKAEEFRKFIALPRLADEPLEIVLNIDPEDPDINALRVNGWTIENPLVVNTPDLYRKYISGSLGEFSCTKGGYSGTQCGWFSDRSACYLAAGRPVVLQSTGFEDVLPVGKGLFAVSSPDEAADAIQRIRADYQLHSSAARAIACEYFDSDKVVRDILTSANIV